MPPRPRRWPYLVAAVALLAMLPAEPWKMLIHVEVSEPAPAGALPLLRGELQSLEHESSGSAVIVEGADGKRWLRLEPFATSNGPDVVVMLSRQRVDGWFGYDEGQLMLGALKGTRGAQNYALPDGVDLTKYASVVIWCQRFHVGFAAAELLPVKAAQVCPVKPPHDCKG